MFSAIPLFSCLSSFSLFSIAISLKNSRVYIVLIEFVGINKKLRVDAFLLFSKRFCLSYVFHGCSMNINIMNITFEAVLNSLFYIFAMEILKWFVWYLNFFLRLIFLKIDIYFIFIIEKYFRYVFVGIGLFRGKFLMLSTYFLICLNYLFNNKTLTSFIVITLIKFNRRPLFTSDTIHILFWFFMKEVFWTRFHF